MMVMKSSITVFGLLMSAWPSEPSAGIASGLHSPGPGTVPALAALASVDASDLPLPLALAFDLAFFFALPLALSAAGCSEFPSACDVQHAVTLLDACLQLAPWTIDRHYDRHSQSM